MEVLSALSKVQSPQEVSMGRMVSHVPKLLAKRGWGPMELFRELTKLDEHIGQQTCYRLAEGNIDFTMQTLEKLCKVFDVPVQNVVEFVKDEQSG